MAKAAKTSETFLSRIQSILDSFDFSYDNVMKLATYLGIGFGLGFVLRRYGKFIFFGLMFSGLLLYGLDSFDLVAINSEKIKLFFGFNHNATLYDVINLYAEWVKNNVALSLSFGIGFIIGHKLG